MIPKKVVQLFFLLAVIAIATTAHATTYYVDYQSGSDSNAGTSKTSPWKHAPGMLGISPSGSSTGDGCSSICNSTTIHPGDSIILKGGDIWPNTTLPWAFTFSGSASTSTYGCTGSGCIYIGYDPTWNLGIVNSVTLTRDLGGCSPSSPPTVSITGGGGSGAAATAYVIPAAAASVEPNVAGFIYHVAVTNQGSGYTSNPTVTISGGGCSYVTAVADIYRPVIDAGGSWNSSTLASSGPDWPVGNTGNSNLQYGPGLSTTGTYLIIDHLEFRNIRQQARTSGILTGVINENATEGNANNVTIENCYIHGRYTDCVLNSCGSSTQEQADSAINFGGYADEISGNTMENGDAYFTGTSATACAQNDPCIFSEHDARSVSGDAGGSEVQHNYVYSVRWGMHQGGNPSQWPCWPSNCLPLLAHNNELWLILYDVGAAHENEMYFLFQTGTFYEYDNVLHSAVSGASNQQQLGAGTNQYFFNNVMWGMGGGTSPMGLDADGTNGTADYLYVYNNTWYAYAGGSGDCIDDNLGQSYLHVQLQNNHCITAVTPYFNSGSNGSNGSTYTDYAGSTTASNIESASVVQTSAVAATNGYLASNAFVPTSNSSPTVAFAGGGTSANLTSLCSGYLVPLCTDINGNARPTTGGWQAGAYYYTASESQPPAAPTGLTAVVN